MSDLSILGKLEGNNPKEPKKRGRKSKAQLAAEAEAREQANAQRIIEKKPWNEAPSHFPPKTNKAEWEEKWTQIYTDNLFYNEACWVVN